MRFFMKYFGTDGIRGKVGKEPITPQFFLRLGWAIGRVFSTRGEHARVLIGKDTRISGYMFESALQAGLAAAGADIRLLGPMPTPAIAYLTHTFRADLGVVISASHNNYIDNGVKFFSGRGIKLSDALERRIEEEVDKEMTMVVTDDLGKAARVVDARGRYIEFCKSTIPYDADLPNWRVVLDCAHGATYNVAPKVFSELGMRIEALHTDPDGININEGCGSTYMNSLRERVRSSRADVGIAFDGDGDRVVMCNRTGDLIDGDLLLYILARYMKSIGTLQGKVIGTVMSNMGLEQALNELDIEMERVPVGDRHIIDALIAKNRGNLGGEASGHIVCTRYSKTGDGIIAALQAFAALRHFSMSLDDLTEAVPLIPVSHENFSCRDPQGLMQMDKMQQAIRTVERELNGNGRLLVRPSGTEPLLRIMVESHNEVLKEELMCRLKKVAHQLATS